MNASGRFALVFVALLLLAGFGCRQESATSMTNETSASIGSRNEDPSSPKTAAWFVDVAPSAGIEFVPRNGAEAKHRAILETLGVGVALFDYDGDGDLDLFVPGGGEFGPGREILGLPPVLFRNEGDRRFTDVTQQAGLTQAAFYSHGAVVGDYNDDGAPDLLVTGYRGLLLYRNNADGTFEQVAEQAGLTSETWTTGAAWGDVDGDGVLDLYLVNYVDWSFEKRPPHCGRSPDERDVCAPADFDAVSDRFYAGNGDGTFREATAEAGLVDGGKGLAVLAADLDLDGDLDLYVTNDTTPNFLYRNDGTGRLQEIGLLSGAALSDTALADGSMGVDLGDFNLDGLPDLWVANYEDQSFALYRNEGDCVFQHVSSRTGISRVGGVYVGFGTVFFDFDRDGDEDLFAGNGHVMYHPRNAAFRQVPLLFENRAGTQFTNVAAQAGPYMASPHVARGVALGDADNDGDLDLAVAHTNEPVALLSNESKDSGHWVQLRLIGTRSHRDAVGARLRLHTPQGTQIRQAKGGASFLSSNDPRIFFGLGRAEVVERIEIEWPSGIRQELSNVPIDRETIVIEPK